MLPEKIQNYCPNSQSYSQVGQNNTVIPLWRIEKNAIQQTIEFCNGNIAKAASLLDIAPSTIYRKMQTWEEIS